MRPPAAPEAQLLGFPLGLREAAPRSGACPMAPVSSLHRLRPSRPYAALGLGCSLDTHLMLLGLSGMLAATFPLAFAYICDVVPEGPARTSAIGSTIGFGLGMAFLVGPPLGSLLDHAYGPRAVFGACLWVTLANVLVALCGIVERPQPQLQP